MSLTEVQRAKLTIEIDRLTTEADKLEAEAKEKDSLFLAAWKEYGSELACSSETGPLYEKVKKLRESLNFLEKVKDGAFLLSDFDILKARLESINRQIEELQKNKKSLKSDLEHFKYLLRILSN